MAVSEQSRTNQALAVLDHVVPLVQAQGMPSGPKSVRWVTPPWTMQLRTFGETRHGACHSLEVWCGRKMFAAEWTDAGEIHVAYFGRGDWVREVLALGNPPRVNSPPIENNSGMVPSRARQKSQAPYPIAARG